jgi:hypothetical protein
VGGVVWGCGLCCREVPIAEYIVCTKEKKNNKIKKK